MMRDVRETLTRLAALSFVVVGTLVVGTQPAMAKSSANCQTALAKKRGATAQIASAPAADKPAVVQVSPAQLMSELVAKVQISRKANDMGFNMNLNPTRAITRDEAMPIVSMMLQMKISDANKVANDIALIQLHGHFDRLYEISNVLASAYASKLDVKKFAQNLAQVQANIFVPNKSEMGFQAQDLRRPDLREAMMVFNVIVAHKGDGRAAQAEILEVAETLNTGDMEVIGAVIFQAEEAKISALEMATAVNSYVSSIKLTKKVMGFGASTEVVSPTALEAVSLLQMGMSMKLNADAMANVVEEIQLQTGATDFATILGALSESMKPEASAK
jgi:hypothetical protein